MRADSVCFLSELRKELKARAPAFQIKPSRQEEDHHRPRKGANRCLKPPLGSAGLDRQLASLCTGNPVWGLGCGFFGIHPVRSLSIKTKVEFLLLYIKVQACCMVPDPSPTESPVCLGTRFMRGAPGLGR